MFPVVQHNNYLAGLNAGRCGWICRQLTKIRNFVADIPILGTRIANALTIAIDVVNTVDETFFRVAQEYIPTAEETQIIDRWQSTRLEPFYRNLLLRVDNAFKKSNIDEQIIEINNILNQICIIESYFSLYEKNGLSNQAVISRSNLLEEIFNPIYEIIDNSFKNKGLISIENNATLNSTNFVDFSPLIKDLQNLTTKCFIYKKTSTTTNNPVVLDVETTTSTETPEKTKSNGKLIIGGLLVVTALAIAFSGEKKENKN